ncbi:MAG: hypothetical protein RL095_8 [Verrucomicrobiota bacterium]|jgi:RNA 3'-terminal phosphate cyclase (ATP)
MSDPSRFLDKDKVFCDHPRYGKTPRYTQDPIESTPWALRHFSGFPITGTAIPCAPQLPHIRRMAHYYLDHEMACQRCGGFYIFFAEEQKHWYEQLQIDLNSHPHHCYACRELYRAEKRQRQEAAQPRLGDVSNPGLKSPTPQLPYSPEISMNDTLLIDGSRGEGGGQILRTSLALAAITGKTVKFTHIRAGRPKPGLARQHLACVRAAAMVCQAEVKGDELGSQELEFRPGKIRGGDFDFPIETGGSSSLVLQTVLPIFLFAGVAAEVRLSGATDNPFAPPLDFLRKSFLPQLKRLGVEVDIDLHRRGFMQRGGASWIARIGAHQAWSDLDLIERGELRSRRAQILNAGLPQDIPARMFREVKKQLGWTDPDCEVVAIPEDQGPGLILQLFLDFAGHSEVFSVCAQRGKSSEQLARQVIDEVKTFLAASAPVGEHLADQLLLPLALAGQGRFRCSTLSSHFTTNIDTIGLFLPDLRWTIQDDPRGGHLVEVRS